MKKSSAIVRQLKKMVAVMARPIIPFATLPLFAAILVAGTVSQHYIGLYESQRLFFSSAPSIALLGVLTLSLACKFLFFSPWSLKRSGVNLAHLGILVLLIGGFMTATQAQEGNLIVAEQEETSLVRDYHKRTLLITDSNGETKIIPFPALYKNQLITLPDNLSRLVILDKCASCVIEKQHDAGETRHGMAKSMKLSPGKPALNNEENIVGITFRIEGTKTQDGIHILFDPTIKPLMIENGGKTFTLMMTKQPRTLPFSIRLDNFESSNHPGTAMARSYFSDVVIKDGDVSWPARIEMNKPLRYKGYTLFQSSFIETEDQVVQSVLAVVYNRSWLFPYIGTALMAFGLLLHTIISFRRSGAV